MLSLNDILDAQAQVESGGNPRARSPVGARGLHQFMPATWKQYGRGDINDPVASRDAAKRYLTDLYHKHGDAALALAAYNGGDGAAAYLAKHPELIARPDYKAPANLWRHQTADYVHKILKMVNPISDANADETPYKEPKENVKSDIPNAPTFEEWEASQQQNKQESQQLPNAPTFEEWEKSQPPIAEQPPKEQTLLEAAGTGLTNLPSSTWNMAKSIGQQVIEHPIDTITAPFRLASGAMDNTLPESLQPSEPSEDQKMASQLADAYKQRYGTMQGFKEVLANDPASILMDLSMAAGGVGLGAKAANAGKIASIADMVGNASNPLMLPINAAKGVSGAVNLAGRSGVAPLLGKTTGKGADPILQAIEAGKTGGAGQQAFIDSLRGKTDFEDVLDSAKVAHGKMYGENSAKYQAELEPILQNPDVLDISRVRNTINDIDASGQLTGLNGRKSGLATNTETAEITQKIKDKIDAFSQLDPAEFHTVKGFDGLKKSIGEIRQATDPHTPARHVVDKVYSAINDTIKRESPDYGSAMSRYATAKNLNDEIGRALSLGDKAMADTAMRKLQSVMRNDVSTNFGFRKSLADKLSEAGAPNLMNEIAGQSLSPAMPGGIAGAVLPASLAGAVFTGGAGIPTSLASILTGSPRLVGEAALKVGQAKRLAGKVTKPVARAYKKGASKARVLSITDKKED